MAENRVTMSLSQLVAWLGLAAVGGALAHQAVTKAPVNEPARQVAEQDAQSREDNEWGDLFLRRRHIAQFDREFPTEERARYVGPLRFRWLSLMSTLRDDPRFANFSVEL